MGVCKLKSKDVTEAFYWEGSQDNEAVLKWIKENREKYSYIALEIEDGVVDVVDKKYKNQCCIVDLNKTPYLVPFVYGDDEWNDFNSYSMLELVMCYDFV